MRPCTVSRIADWSAAERILGYPILKGVNSSLTWPYLFVQPELNDDPSIPRSAIGLYKIDGVGVGFTVAPLSMWNDGALQRGEPLAIAGRGGWLRYRGSDSDDSFPCGNSDRFGEIWCQVEMNSKSPDLLARFVKDLTLP